jgi:hypothetical protein
LPDLPPNALDGLNSLPDAMTGLRDTIDGTARAMFGIFNGAFSATLPATMDVVADDGSGLFLRMATARYSPLTIDCSTAGNNASHVPILRDAHWLKLGLSADLTSFWRFPCQTFDDITLIDLARVLAGELTVPLSIMKLVRKGLQPIDGGCKVDNITWTYLLNRAQWPSGPLSDRDARFDLNWFKDWITPPDDFTGAVSMVRQHSTNVLVNKCLGGAWSTHDAIILIPT